MNEDDYSTSNWEDTGIHTMYKERKVPSRFFEFGAIPGEFLPGLGMLGQTDPFPGTSHPHAYFTSHLAPFLTLTRGLRASSSPRPAIKVQDSSLKAPFHLALHCARRVADRRPLSK